MGTALRSNFESHHLTQPDSSKYFQGAPAFSWGVVAHIPNPRHQEAEQADQAYSTKQTLPKEGEVVCLSREH